MQTVNPVVVREYPFGSPEYHHACGLRERMLRLPLGRRLEAVDTADDCHQWHFGGFNGTELIACVIAKPSSGKSVKLRQMAVADAFQRQGVGAELISAVEAILNRRGIVNLELAARRTAVGFYQRMGYRVEGKYFKALAIDHVKMVKTLPAGR